MNGSLGRLLRRGGGVGRALFSRFNSPTNSSYTSSHAPSSFNLPFRLQGFTISGVAKETTKDLGSDESKEAKTRLCSAETTLASNNTNKGTEVENQKIKGDILDFQDLLFTENRDYLIKHKHNQKVKAEQLMGKIIVICFVPLYYDLRRMRWDTVDLMDVYYDLQPNNSLEVVFVATDDVNANSVRGDSQMHFEEKFACIPWTAIPFSDTTSRERLQNIFDVSGRYCSIFAIDSTGMVLKEFCRIIFEYGALGYPFTDERLKFLREDDEAASKQPSLNVLLASPERDYLISNKQEKVPIQKLEDKVVALYFYEDFPNRHKEDQNTKELKMAYEELAKLGQKFEVVLIYLSDTVRTYGWTDEGSFWKQFKTMPWLALPFKDPNHKKLKRILGYPCESEFKLTPRIVIFGPHGEFIEPLGNQIMNMYGISAYPFTRKEVPKLETEKVKELKLEMLWDPNTVFTKKDGSQVLFSELAGKMVILFFERLRDSNYFYGSLNIEFLQKLKERYLQMKGSDDEFEVIHILESKANMYIKTMLPLCESFPEVKLESDATKHIGDMPWLVSSDSNFLHPEFVSYLSYGDDFLGEQSSIFAFDRDGGLVRRTIYPTFEDSDFPFRAGGLEEECLSQLIAFNGWNYWDYYSSKVQIYSYKDTQAKKT